MVIEILLLVILGILAAAFLFKLFQSLWFWLAGCRAEQRHGHAHDNLPAKRAGKPTPPSPAPVSKKGAVLVSACPKAETPEPGSVAASHAGAFDARPSSPTAPVAHSSSSNKRKLTLNTQRSQGEG